MKLPLLYPVLITFLHLSTAGNLYAQSDKAVSDSTYVTAEELIDQLEYKFNLHIYYKNEWFLNRKINSGVFKESLQQCLDRLKNISGCDYLAIDSSSFIFIPYEVAITGSSSYVSDDYIVIGKMSEYGKYSTANVSGKISDGKTGNPIFGAIVSIDKNKIGSTTDKNGNFTIPLPVGEHEIKMSYIGYEDDYIKIKLVSDGRFNHELFEYSVKLDEVVILADRADHNISLTQMSIVKLDAKTIHKLPVSLGEADIIKSVSLLPGVQSVGEFGAGFLVRGGSADQNLILIEGVPVFNTSHVFGLTSVINSDGINSVTLLKAGMPVKYGERVSSVMDIRLGVEKEKFITKGGLGLLSSRLNVEVPIVKDKVSLLLGGRSSYSSWLLHKIPDSDLMNSSAGFYDLNGLLTVDITKKSKLTIFGYYSHDKFNFSENNRYNYSNTLISVRWNQIISGTLYTTLIAGFSGYNYQVSQDDSIQKAEAYRIESSIRYKSLKWNFTWLPSDIHSIDFGINAIYYNISPGKLSPYSSESLINPVTVSQENALEMAIYAGDEIAFSPVISAEVGMRYSAYRLLGPGIAYQFYENLPRSPESILDTLFYSKGETICKYGGLEPRLAFRYSLSGSSSLKLSYSRINQYINLISNTAVLSPTDMWKLSSLNLKPLMADQFAIGYFKNLKNNSFEISVEFYYKKMNNVVEYRNGAKILINPLIECDLLNATGYNYGIELYAKKNSEKLTGWISYTFSKSLRQTNGTFELDQVNGNKRFMSNYDKPHNLIIMANYNLSRRLYFSGTFVYNTGRPVTLPEFKYNYQGNQVIYYSDRNKYRLPDYHRLDISVTLNESLRVKKKWKGSWTLSIINLYGRKNAYSVFYKKEVPVASNNYKMFSLYKLYIIGRPLPTLTYIFTF